MNIFNYKTFKSRKIKNFKLWNIKIVGNEYFNYKTLKSRKINNFKL
jgi:hypothetical protein